MSLPSTTYDKPSTQVGSLVVVVVGIVVIAVVVVVVVNAVIDADVTVVVVGGVVEVKQSLGLANMAASNETLAPEPSADNLTEIALPISGLAASIVTLTAK